MGSYSPTSHHELLKPRGGDTHAHILTSLTQAVVRNQAHTSRVPEFFNFKVTTFYIMPCYNIEVYTYVGIVDLANSYIFYIDQEMHYNILSTRIVNPVQGPQCGSVEGRRC